MIRISRLSAALLVLILLSLAPIASQAQQLRYFRHINYDRAHHFYFTRELFGLDTQLVRHYKVTYDSLGRISEWRYYRYGNIPSEDPGFGLGGVAIAFNGKSQYYRFFNEKRVACRFTTGGFAGEGHYAEYLIINENTHDSSGEYMQLFLYDRSDKRMYRNSSNASSFKCYYDSTGTIRRKVFLDGDGHVVLGSDGSCELTYENDSMGYMTDLRGYDLEHRENWRDHYTNNADGHWLERNSLDSLGRPHPDYYTQRYKYDKNGYMTSHGRYDDQEQLVDMTTFEYDERGNKVISRSYDEENVLTEQVEYYYDSTNLYKGHFVSNEADGAVSRDSVVHDDQDRVTEVWYFQRYNKIDSNLHAVRSIRQIYQSGWSDVLTQYRNYRGELIPNEDGVAQVRTFRDKYGNLIEIRNMNELGEPMESLEDHAAFIKYTYGDDGLYKGGQYFNKDGYGVIPPAVQ